MHTRERRTPIEVAAIVAVLVIPILIWAAYAGHWQWTGFPAYLSPAHPKEQEFDRGKTLWDWLQLLIIPAALGLATVWYNARQTRRADLLANDNRAEEALTTYVERISELLLQHHLTGIEDADVRAVARARTLMALRNLNEHRKVILLRFLYDSRLIDREHRVIDLRGANLNGIVIRDTHLAVIDLSGAKVRFADLEGCNLEQAILKGVDFAGTNLRRTNLRAAVLGGGAGTIRRCDRLAAEPDRSPLG